MKCCAGATLEVPLIPELSPEQRCQLQSAVTPFWALPAAGLRRQRLMVLLLGVGDIVVMASDDVLSKSGVQMVRLSPPLVAVAGYMTKEEELGFF